MSYTAKNARRQIHPAGSTPPAETREVRTGASIVFEIGDPRTLLKTDKLQNAGFTRDQRDNSLWTTHDRAAFEEMVKDISATPYYVIEPQRARFAKDALREAGFKTFALKQPFLNNTGDNRDWYFVLRNKGDYDKAKGIADKAFQIQPEQVTELKTAAATGVLTDDIAKRLDCGNNVEEMLAFAESGSLSQLDHGKLMRAITPISPELIKSLRALIDDGRLTETNSKMALDDASISKLTQEQYYNLENAGRKFANAKQRAQLHYLMDQVRDGHSRRDEQALRDGMITYRDAQTLIASKLNYVSPDERKMIEAIDGSAVIETSAERKQKLSEQLASIASEMGKSQPFAFKKRDAYFIAAANAGGLVLRDREGTLHVASGKEIWMPDELADNAARTEGNEGKLIGSVVVVKNAKSAMGRPQVYPSNERTIGGALALDDALAEAKGMGISNPQVVEPKAGAKLTVWGTSDTHAAGITQDQQIMVVPREQVQTNNGPAHFNDVVEVLAAEAPAAPARTTRAKAGAGR